jgi:PPP family 3-phenylpropionic acid transporter
MKLTVSRQMITVMSIMALGVLAMSILQPMMPLYLTSIGVTPEIVGLMLSVAMVGMVIGESFWGWVADKTGAKLSLIVGTFISGLAVFCFVFTQNAAFIFTIFFFWGLARSALFGPGRGYIGANAPVLRKATFMAIIAMMMTASRSIGALPSGFLSDNLGFHAVFFVSCGISLLAGIVVLVSFRQAQPLKVQAITARVPPLGDLPSSVQRVSYRPFATQCVVTALQFWGQGTLMGFLPLLATQVVGVSATEVGVLFTIYGIAIMLMSIPMGMLADQIGNKILMTFGLMISGAAMAGMAFSQSYAWLMIFVFTSGIGMATFSPAALGMISDSVSPKWQSTAMGIYGAFGENIGIIAGASLGGFIWISWGPQSTFLMGTVATALGLVICLALVKDKVATKL